MKVNEYFVPVRPLKVVHNREFVITNDGKTVATIQQDLYDRLRNIVADKYRVIAEDNDLKGMLKDGAHNFPEEIRILENVRREMEGKLNAEQLAEQPVYEKVQNALFTKGKEAEELVAKQDEVRAKLIELSRAVIEAKGTIYDGVKAWYHLCLPCWG